MIKNNYNIKIDYIYNPQKKFTKYSLDGIKWYNYGEIAEILYKSVLGYKPTKDKNNSFDVVSDIKETQTSVKSLRATLTTKKIGCDFASIKKAYFEQVASNNVSFVIFEDKTLTSYNMNMLEFEMFLDKFWTYEKDRQVIRLRNLKPKTIIQWLESL